MTLVNSLLLAILLISGEAIAENSNAKTAVGGGLGAAAGAVGGGVGGAVTTKGEGRTGVVIGGAAGGATGAVVGRKVSGSGTGAVIGAGVGGAGGAVVGKVIAEPGKSSNDERYAADDEQHKRHHKHNRGRGACLWA